MALEYLGFHIIAVKYPVAPKSVQLIFDES